MRSGCSVRRYTTDLTHPSHRPTTPRHVDSSPRANHGWLSYPLTRTPSTQTIGSSLATRWVELPLILIREAPLTAPAPCPIAAPVARPRSGSKTSAIRSVSVNKGLTWVTAVTAGTGVEREEVALEDLLLFLRRDLRLSIREQADRLAIRFLPAGHENGLEHELPILHGRHRPAVDIARRKDRSPRTDRASPRPCGCR